MNMGFLFIYYLIQPLFKIDLFLLLSNARLKPIISMDFHIYLFYLVFSCYCYILKDTDQLIGIIFILVLIAYLSFSFMFNILIYLFFYFVR